MTSIISITDGSEMVKSVLLYHHRDMERISERLKKNYTESEQVWELVQGGNICSLGESVVSTGYMHMSQDVAGHSLPWEPIEQTICEMINYMRITNSECAYMFDNGMWYRMINNENNLSEWTEL